MPEKLHLSLVRFGGFELNLQSGELRKHGVRLRLPGQSLKILAVLLEHQGEIVTREDLRKSLWPEDTFVDFEHSVNSAVKRLRDALNDSAENPRFIETLPRLGYRYCGPTVDRPLAEVVNQIPSASIPPEVPAPMPQLPPSATIPNLGNKTNRALPRLAFACFIVVALILGFNLAGLRDRAVHLVHPSAPNSTSTLAAVKLRPSVAVIGFKNLSARPEEAWLSTAFAEMLTTELGAGGQLRTIPEEDIARAKNDLSLHDADSFNKETLTRIRQNLGSDRVVVGSYTALGKDSGGQIRLDLRLQDAVSGETLAVLSATGTTRKLFQVVSQAGAEARQKLGIPPVPADDTSSLLASLPQNPEASRLYSEGLMKLRTFDNLAAKDRLQKAAELEPNFALTHAALSVTWRLLGYDQESMQEGKKAFDLSTHLPREQQMLAEAQYREATKDWNHAIEINRTLFQSYPDSLDYGLRLARTQTRAGKGQDALATVEALKKLPPPARDDPRIDQAEAFAAESLGDYRRQLAAAQRAAGKGTALGARLLVARALQHQCEAMSAMGQLQEATKKCEQAQYTYAETGDLHSSAQTITYTAIILDDQGDFIASRSKYDQALAICRRIGDGACVADELNNIGILLGEQGDLLGARKLYEQALASYREIDNNVAVAAILGNLGNVLRRQGELSTAQSRYAEALAMDREIGDQYTVTEWLQGSALLLYDRADLAGSKKLLEQADPIVHEIGNNERTAANLFVWGKVLSAQDDLAGAKSKFQEALKLHTGMGAKKDAALDELELADLSIEEGRPESAAAPCQAAGELFRSEKNADDEILSRAILAKALLAQSNPQEAWKETESLMNYVAHSQNRENRLQVAVTAARAHAALGRIAEAKRSLNANRAEALKYGFGAPELETRLALGALEIKSGSVVQGRARLAALEKDAAAKGFLLIARKAHAAALPNL